MMMPSNILTISPEIRIGSPTTSIIDDSLYKASRIWSSSIVTLWIRLPNHPQPRRTLIGFSWQFREWVLFLEGVQGISLLQYDEVYSSRRLCHALVDIVFYNPH